MTKASTISIGTVLAQKYRVESVLGEGGMGSVYKATHLLVGEPVALKLLRSDLAEHPEASARFLREAKTAMRLKSENVARVLDVGAMEGGVPYIVIELLEGQDLGKLLDDRGPLSPEDAVDLTLQACHALVEAHAAGVIHRDIKPANLFLTRDASGRRVLKLLDFGISKLQDDAESITKTSAVMGSVPYMSPEQLESSKSVDARSDIYSLGVTLYELLTGTLPFEGETMPQMCASIIKGRAIEILQRRSSLPKDLAAVVHRAFSPDPAERHANAVAFAASLLPFATASGRAFAQRIPGIGVESPSVRPPSPLAATPRAARPAHADDTLLAPDGPKPAQVAPAISGARHDTQITLTASPQRAQSRRAVWVGVSILAVASAVGVVVFSSRTEQVGSKDSAGAAASSAAAVEVDAARAMPGGPAGVSVSPSTASAVSSAADVPVATTSASVSPPPAGTGGRPVVAKTASPPPRPSAPPPIPTSKPSSGVWGRN